MKLLKLLSSIGVLSILLSSYAAAQELRTNLVRKTTSSTDVVTSPLAPGYNGYSQLTISVTPTSLPASGSVSLGRLRIFNDADSGAVIFDQTFFATPTGVYPSFIVLPMNYAYGAGADLRITINPNSTSTINWIVTAFDEQ